MERRKVVSKKRYVLAFIIGTLIFLFGFAITYGIAYLEYYRVSALQDPLSYEIFKDKLQYTLFEKDPCSEEGYLEISQDLAFQGRIINDLEGKLGKADKNVLFRKRFYSLVELEHFELVNLINKECNRKINTILFFYSNKEEDLGHSEELGNLLSHLHERNSDDLVIYSFDLNLDSEIIASLKQKYNVTDFALIILNENQRFTQIQNINQIEPLLN